jgi:hypothetical protein
MLLVTITSNVSAAETVKKYRKRHGVNYKKMRRKQKTKAFFVRTFNTNKCYNK